MPTNAKPKRIQKRSSATRSSLLAAAERAFSRRGFEQAQMEEIAEDAGFSKGGLYAHFKSKDEVFLALYEMRNANYLRGLDDAIAKETTAERKREAFKAFYLDLSKDRNWALLSLEFKSYALRYPEAQKRLREIDQAQAALVDGSLLKSLGHSSIPAAAALGSILPALVMQSLLDPHLLGETLVRKFLGQIFDAILRPAGAGDHAETQHAFPAEHSAKQTEEM